jgi:glutamyl-tRNA synthetase
MSVRVRFAPSPTGYLHVGGARTALFNWLFAKQKEGSFVLRIEDTDVERSDDAMVRGILEGLEWLGLIWDEGPYFQSERCQIYSRAVEQLLGAGRAYKDFSPPGQSPEIGTGESAVNVSEKGLPYAVRFRVPKNRRISFEDLVYGRIEVDTRQIEDFVIQRSNGTPTYHLSVVVDDTEMAISHVIRGADHLSNTSKHVMLYHALDEVVPTYCHLPLILGTDKKRLSKRHGATSLVEYSRQGFLPEAVRNYLALLGWSPGGDDEILKGDALIDRFDLSRINKANAVFDLSKLRWMNKRYLSAEPASSLVGPLRTQLKMHGLWKPAWEAEDRTWFLGVVDLVKSRVEDLNDFAVYGRPFLTDDFEYDQAAVDKFLKFKSKTTEKNLRQGLLELRNAYEHLEPFELANTETVLRSLAERNELKTGAFIGAVRLATTGRSKAPGIFDVLITLGREKTVERLDRLIRFLE